MKPFYMMKLLLWGILHTTAQSSGLQQDSGLVLVGVGDNVTLRCFHQGNTAMHFSWYQQMLGSKLQLLSTIYKYDKNATLYNPFKNNSRFSVHNDKGINHLSISNVRRSDSATYYCGSAHSNIVVFGEGVFLSVEESSFKAIAQQPVSESVQPGDSVTLNCTVHTETCDGDHNVYWFRPGHPTTVRTRDDQCEDVSERGSPAQSCVYHLQKRNVSLSDAGTYYCAVASCGEIRFGNGSKLDIVDVTEYNTDPMRILVLLSITRIGILLSFLTICTLFYVAKKWSTQ